MSTEWRCKRSESVNISFCMATRFPVVSIECNRLKAVEVNLQTRVGDYRIWASNDCKARLWVPEIQSRRCDRSNSSDFERVADPSGKWGSVFSGYYSG